MTQTHPALKMQATLSQPLASFPDMKQRHAPVMEGYRQDPSLAWTVDRAVTSSRVDARDALRGHVVLGPEQVGELPIALHTNVGGDSALPVPGDLLCAALASCLDSALRVIANRLELQLRALCVDVRAEVDVRGTLLVDPNVPVGFQRVRAHVQLDAGPDADPRKLELLGRTAEHCCVVLQTLRNGVDVATEFDLGAT